MLGDVMGMLLCEGLAGEAGFATPSSLFSDRRSASMNIFPIFLSLSEMKSATS